MEDSDIEAAYEFLHDGNAKRVRENKEEDTHRFLFECCNSDEQDLSILNELEKEGVKCFINEFQEVKRLDKMHISKYEYVFELLVLNEDYKKGLSIWCRLTGEKFEDYYEEFENTSSEDLSSFGGKNKTNLDITDTEWKEFVAENEAERKQNQRFYKRFAVLLVIMIIAGVLLTIVLK